ncbi:MAG: TonB-dependent receptor plug domain-containing protein [Cyanobacteria bacterium P01_D01_bin.156]
MESPPEAPRLAQEAPEDTEEETEDDGLLLITVTGTRTPRPIQTVPVTVDVIDADDVNRLLIRDISDLTRYEPGVSVNNNLQFGLQGFNICGIDGNRVLIQVDDIRLPSAFQSGDRVTVGQGFNVDRDYFDSLKKQMLVYIDTGDFISS